MVCAENSSIKSELVEVDEIFNEETFWGPGLKAKGLVSDIPSKIINLEQPYQEQSPRQFPEPGLDEDSQMTASAMNRAIKAERRISPTPSVLVIEKEGKKFFLIDEKKGFRARQCSEIQSLFQRGIISTLGQGAKGRWEENDSCTAVYCQLLRQNESRLWQINRPV